MPQQMDVHELARRLSAGEPVFLLDVREPWEHERAALPGSVLIPLRDLPQRVVEVAPPEDATVVVYCHHGIRSLHAAAFLERSHVGRAFSLAGGIDAWSREVDPSLPRY